MQSAHKSLGSVKDTDISRSSIVDDREDDAIAIAKLLSILEMDSSPYSDTKESSESEKTTTDSSIVATSQTNKNDNEVSLTTTTTTTSQVIADTDVMSGDHSVENANNRITSIVNSLSADEIDLSVNDDMLEEHQLKCMIVVGSNFGFRGRKEVVKLV